jgi:hypothetical protein
MRNIGYLIVTIGVTALSRRPTGTGCMSSGVQVISVFSANILSNVPIVPKTLLITIDTDNLILDGYQKFRCFWEYFASL